MNLLSHPFHRSLLVICLLSFSLLSHAQNVAFAWGRSISGSGIIWSTSTADAVGNVYTVGNFTGTADFDPDANTVNLTAAGTGDAFISKLDATGNYVWVIQLGSTSSDAINDVAVDARGNIYVVGYGATDIDFDPGAGTVTLPGSGSFVAKYDTDGNYIWATRSTGGGVAIAVDANENIYLTSHAVRGTIYNPTEFANDTYIKKLNSTGVVQWSKMVSGKNEDIAWSIAVDGDGNVITGGSTLSDTLDLDPGPGVYNMTREGGGFDVFLIKLDPSGNFIWGGAITAEYPYDLKTDAGNNIYVTGLFGGMSDFNPGAGTYHLTAAGADPFILKLNPAGNMVWVKQLAGVTNTFAYAKAMELDASGNIYTSGFVKGRFDMDPGPDSVMVNSVAAGGPFVSKLDADGNFIWGKVFGGSTMAQSYGIGVDAAQNVYTTGFFKDTIDLDPGPDTAIIIAAPGAQGVFINKLAPIASGPLPLTWLNVEGRLNSYQQATIMWNVTETNVQRYAIEKSTDGRAFNAIGSVTAAGDGTHSYTFTEETVLQQTAWYRILQTDIDGRFTYSSIIRIAGGNAQSTVTVYPVPARHQVTISVTGDELLHTKAVLADRSGRTVKTIYLNNPQMLLPLDKLNAGLYFLLLANGQTKKIMKQN